MLYREFLRDPLLRSEFNRLSDPDAGIEPGPITQSILRLDVELARVATMRRRLRKGVFKQLDANAEVEPGGLNLRVVDRHRPAFSQRNMAAAVGHEKLRQYLSLMPVKRERRLFVVPSAELLRTDGGS